MFPAVSSFPPIISASYWAGRRPVLDFLYILQDGTCRSRQAGGKREAEFRASPQTLFSSPKNVDVSFDRKFLVLGHSFLRWFWGSPNAFLRWLWLSKPSEKRRPFGWFLEAAFWGLLGVVSGHFWVVSSQSWLSQFWISSCRPIWGFPKIKGTFLGVPIVRTIVYWGLYWGTLILGNYHLACSLFLGCWKLLGGAETRA